MNKQTDTNINTKLEARMLIKQDLDFKVVNKDIIAYTLEEFERVKKREETDFNDIQQNIIKMQAKAAKDI
jgi:hypothetical protein